MRELPAKFRRFTLHQKIDVRCKIAVHNSHLSVSITVLHRLLLVYRSSDTQNYAEIFSSQHEDVTNLEKKNNLATTSHHLQQQTMAMKVS